MTIIAIASYGVSTPTATARPGEVNCEAFLEPPAPAEKGIWFEANIRCVPRPPQHSKYWLYLMKVDYRDYKEYEVTHVYAMDPDYQMPEGHNVSGYWDCTQYPEVRVDGYFTKLHVYQTEPGDFVDIVITQELREDISC
ncbi:hypothetical protein [Nocardia brasiliensis]